MDLADAFGRLSSAFDYPMFVVTAAAGDERAGCLVGFTTQCSIDPPRLLVCLSRKNHTYRVALRSDLLGVHLLDRDQEALAVLFGGETGDAVDKFDRCRWTPGPEGLPLLDDCPNRILGRVIDRLDGGDHIGFLLDPVEVSATDADPGPLLTFQQVRHLEPGHRA